MPPLKRSIIVILPTNRPTDLKKISRLPVQQKIKLPSPYWEYTLIKENFDEFADAIKHIKTKFLTHFVDCIIKNVQSTTDVEDLLFIPPSLFDDDKPFIFTGITFSENKYRFYQKIPSFTNEKYRI